MLKMATMAFFNSLLVGGWPSAARVNLKQPTQAAEMCTKLTRFGAKSAVERPAKSAAVDATDATLNCAEL